MEDTAMSLDPAPELPDGYVARRPETDDLPALTAMIGQSRERIRGEYYVNPEIVRTEAVGWASWTRRQVVVLSEDGEIAAWATVHDRAAGRADVRLIVAPDVPERDALATGLMDWIVAVAKAMDAERGVEQVRLEMVLDAGDEDAHRWARAAGLEQRRTWLNMSRPVVPDETIPEPKPGVLVRRVGVHEFDDGTTMPVAEDLQTVHRMLEESFADHYNSYRESFPEFVARLREDPGHRWDHWWLALLQQEDGSTVPGGAVVSTVLPQDASGAHGSYIDYIGVHARSRGRGVAKALLWTVIADAEVRGRNRVELEVDGDSPTHADQIYLSMGWQTKYVTESWACDLDLT